MYGLLLANMQEYVEKTFGQKAWEEVREALKIKVRIGKRIVCGIHVSLAHILKFLELLKSFLLKIFKAIRLFAYVNTLL